VKRVDGLFLSVDEAELLISDVKHLMAREALRADYQLASHLMPTHECSNFLGGNVAIHAWCC